MPPLPALPQLLAARFLPCLKHSYKIWRRIRRGYGRSSTRSSVPGLALGGRVFSRRLHRVFFPRRLHRVFPRQLHRVFFPRQLHRVFPGRLHRIFPQRLHRIFPRRLPGPSGRGRGWVWRPDRR